VYPNLLVPLLVILAALAAGILLIAIRHPVSRRLALRQLARRRSEAALAIIGSTLGTAIIAGSLVVGDTLGASVREAAYRTLGPIDERVLTADVRVGDAIADRLAALREHPDVDGVLTAHLAEGAAVVVRDGVTVAEPRVLVWGLDLRAAASFGAAGGPSGLGGPTPPAGHIVINDALASSLHVGPGDGIELYFFGEDHLLKVSRVVPERGIAGAGLGSTVNRNAFIAPSILDASARVAQKTPRVVTLVSNRGGVEAGANRTEAVTAAIRGAIGGLAGKALVETPKKDVLDAAKVTGDSLGALFLMIGSFSIIAGALLLVNIFVMLAEERKSQLGMLRAVGMKRSEMVGSLTLEGSSYALAAVLPGTLLGLGVGWTVAQVAAQIFRNFSATGEGLTIRFAVTSTSLVNAAALGLIIGIATILVTSVRISRFNVIAAIRDLPHTQTRRARRFVVVAATALAVLAAVAAVPAVAASQAETTYLLPAAAALFLIPLLRELTGARPAITAAAAAVLLWSLLAPLLRPAMFDQASMAVFVISGSLVAFSGVALVSQNQDVVLAPVRALFERPGETGLAVRLAVAYPLAKRFRTGATLVMYTLITLVLVLLVEVSGVINASIDRQVTDATAGYAMRLDFNAADATHTLASLRSGEFREEIAMVTPLLSAPASASDPGHRTDEPLRALAVGVPDNTVSSMAFTKRITGYPTDAQVWALVAADPRYVVLDSYVGSAGGPPSNYYGPGDTFTMTDPRTGDSQEKVIAGILTNALPFYPVAGTYAGNTVPIVGSATWVRDQFGAGVETTSAFVRTAPGVDAAGLASRLQGSYLADSLVATPLRASVRRMFAANIEFFRLMQGFLALGLAIGITGLGVVMVRAVRERRRTIGVLRALGFRARTVERSFLLESGLVAVEGILLGSVLGVLTTWLMYQKSAMFEGIRIAFPIEWLAIAVLAGATVLASLAATLTPARNAARIQPAIAVRVAD
jgi:putative ABC transport system permease protein